MSKEEAVSVQNFNLHLNSLTSDYSGKTLVKGSICQITS